MHAQAAFVDWLCLHCERMSTAMTSLQLSFIMRVPLISNQSSSALPALTEVLLSTIELLHKDTSPCHEGPSGSFGAPEEVKVSIATCRDRSPLGEGCKSLLLQLGWSQGFTALISLCPRRAVGYHQSWICECWIGPSQASIQDVDAEQMNEYLLWHLSNSPNENHFVFCSKKSAHTSAITLNIAQIL